MEYNNSKEKEVVVDIDSVSASGGADTRTGPNLGRKRGKKLLNKLTSGVLGLNRSTKDEASSNPRGLGKDSHEAVELLIDKGPGDRQIHELLSLIEKKHEKERWKTGKSKKAAAKPPRPPKGPSLDAADMKLVREISEHATKKRERIDPMKALKMKAAKKSSPSSTTTISAMIITILFFLVMIFQGLGSKKSLIETSLGAPEQAIETEGLISVEFYKSREQVPLQDDRITHL
ncbi:lysine-specific demethylase PHF2-like [Olea europaea subsp. europaea]|uniref:Lysine-specific demethylase PHF2-like n=2 Tax=Olea europaea subsp. europaea TaxID=158383 RepID=A0A8S0PXR3_OLEEU|nr:lysine-specific demethylase PHF2-like [Olea europaea subsp. europaea]